MDNLEILQQMKNHIKKEATFKLKNKEGTEDEFKIKPLPFNMYPEVWYVTKEVYEILKSGVNLEELVTAFKKETIGVITNIIKCTIRYSFFDVEPSKIEEELDKEREKIVQDFARDNLWNLFIVIMPLNRGNVEDGDDRKLRRLEARMAQKQREKDVKNTGNVSNVKGKETPTETAKSNTS